MKYSTEKVLNIHKICCGTLIEGLLGVHLVGRLHKGDELGVPVHCHALIAQALPEEALAVVLSEDEDKGIGTQIVVDNTLGGLHPPPGLADRIQRAIYQGCPNPEVLSRASFFQNGMSLKGGVDFCWSVTRSSPSLSSWASPPVVPIPDGCVCGPVEVSSPEFSVSSKNFLCANAPFDGALAGRVSMNGSRIVYKAWNAAGRSAVYQCRLDPTCTVP